MIKIFKVDNFKSCVKMFFKKFEKFDTNPIFAGKKDDLEKEQIFHKEPKYVSLCVLI